ncbi:MAG: phosphatidylserine decarboxylase family protein [Firmicutes bacterium]|nr:phosphatidylserine decarboxylase family protein [Bacillota bacterium]
MRLTWHYLAVLTALSLILYYRAPLLFPVPASLAAFVLFFFRNPKRKIPSGEGLVLSPADGMVMEIDTVYEDNFMKNQAIRVSIFLSLFDVHLNRSPLPGTVAYRHYRPGKFIPAFKSHASDINEKNYVGIESTGGKILVCQITGFIARRIKCWAGKGKTLAAGEIFGIIKFGSGTELFLPPQTKILVKKGDRVKAGETIIGVLRGNQSTGEEWASEQD